MLKRRNDLLIQTTLLKHQDGCVKQPLWPKLKGYLFRVPFEIKGCKFLPLKKGVFKQVNCLEIQPESSDGILVAG